MDFFESLMDRGQNQIGNALLERTSGEINKQINKQTDWISNRAFVPKAEPLPRPGSAGQPNNVANPNGTGSNAANGFGLTDGSVGWGSVALIGLGISIFFVILKKRKK